MSMVNVTINGQKVECSSTATVLEAARIAGIEIPTLCYLKEINAIGACRICMVEVKGARTLVAACVYPVADGMEVFTNTQKVRDSRKMTLELILSNHRKDCLTCVRNLNCELQTLATEFCVDGVRFVDDELQPQIECSTLSVVRDNSKCVLCRRCTAVCKETQEVAVIGPCERGFATRIGSPMDRSLGEMACIACGQCIISCPTGALTEVDNTAEVYKALADETKHVVVMPAPAVRVALGECFGMPVGTNVEGKMVAAMRRLGFDKVFDVGVGADFTIMEEGSELIGRLNSGENLPIITSCCPSWVSYCEHYHPELISNLSSCKSPLQMTGALTKAYYAEKNGIDPKDVFVVTVMPCTAKKYEIKRPDQQAIPGIDDVDAVITTREFGRMIKNAGIQFTNLPDESFDPELGRSTGAGYIFGTTGGVTEAALRTVMELSTCKVSDLNAFHAVRGMEGLKEAVYDLDGKQIKVAVVSGQVNTGKLLERVKAGEAHYDVIEVMSCPGGCIGGGGQPVQSGTTMNFTDVDALRGSALHQGGAGRNLQKSHESSTVEEVYKEVLGEPGSHLAHEWLHTTYQQRPKYPGLESEK